MNGGALFRRLGPAPLLAAMLFVLMLVYPVPHTIALRNILLVAFLAGCAVPLRRAGRAAVVAAWAAQAPLRTAAWLMAALTTWLLLQSTLVSARPAEALNMLRGDWLIAIIAFSAGAAAVLTVRTRVRTRVREGGRDARPLLRALVLALFAHVAVLLAYQGWRWLGEGVFPFARTPFAEKDYHSVVVTALLALLLADLVAQRLGRGGALGWPAAISLAMAAACCVGAVTLSSRNAVIIAVCLVALSAGVLLAAKRGQAARWLAPTLAALLLFGGTLGWWGVRSDARWGSFLESAAVAVQTETHRAWLAPGQYPWPTTASGQPVEESAYLRVAWAKVALEQIARHPLGLGYGHKAFGWAVDGAYGLRSGHESSHSGLLDFTLANGIPGILMWLGLSAALAAAGWRRFRRDGSPAGLLLAFTVAAYFLRCLLDGHLSGFRLEMYALMVGALVAAMPAGAADAPDPD